MASDLSLQVTSSASSVLAHTDVTYTIATNNTGPNTVTDSAITALVPNGATYLGSPGWTCLYDPDTRKITCPIGMFTPGSGPSIQIVLRPTVPGSMSFGVTLNGAEPEPRPANNSARAVVHVSPSTDLSVTQSASQNPVAAGDDLTYTVVVSNAPGAGPATRVRLTDTLQRGSYFVSASGADCLPGGTLDVVSCDLGTLGPGASRTVAITAKAGPIGQITNRVEVVSAEGDTDPTNNGSALQTTVLPRSCSPRPPVSVRVTESGPDHLVVTVRSQSPPELPNNQVGALRFGPVPSSPQNPMSNALIDVADQRGRDGPFEIALPRAPDPAPVTFSVRRAQVGQQTFVPFVVVDDCGEWPTFVGGGAPPWGVRQSLAVTSATTSARVGQNLTYTLTARNIGERAVDESQVVNTIPDGTTLVSATPSPGSCAGTRPVVCEVGRLEPNGTATVTFVVLATAAGDVYNSTYATSNAYNSPDAVNVVSVRSIVDWPPGGPPANLPNPRTMPSGSGLPSALPAQRSGTGSGSPPAALPASR